MAINKNTVPGDKSAFIPGGIRIAKAMECYRPSVVVMCCGADSLSGDRVGCWNLSIRGHAQCLEYMKSFNVPLLVLGGGGYTIRNVSRCWAFETARLLDQVVVEP